MASEQSDDEFSVDNDFHKRMSNRMYAEKEDDQRDFSFVSQMFDESAGNFEDYESVGTQDDSLIGVETDDEAGDRVGTLNEKKAPQEGKEKAQAKALGTEKKGVSQAMPNSHSLTPTFSHWSIKGKAAL